MGYNESWSGKITRKLISIRTFIIAATSCPKFHFLAALVPISGKYSTCLLLLYRSPAKKAISNFTKMYF